MKKINKFVVLVFCAMLSCMVCMASCKGGPSKEELAKQEQAMKDSIAKAVQDSVKAEQQADSIAQAKADSIQNVKDIINFITDMYNYEKYYDYDFLKQHCSKSLLKKLRDAYDYVCDDGDCYAGWLFRSGAGEGPSNLHKIISVKSLGEGWFRYDFYDMGIKAANKVKVEKKGGYYIFTELEEAYRPGI